MRNNPKKDISKILLVEDDPAHAELAIRGISNSNIESEIHHVEDGQKALDYLKGHGEFSDREKYPVPDVILLDLRLPKIDGLEVLKQVKEDQKLCVIPVIILTTSNAETDTIKAYTKHANSYLVKPVDGDSFEKMMKGIKAYWVRLNYTAPKRQ